MPINSLLRRQPAARRNGLMLAFTVPLAALALTGCEESRYSMPVPVTEQGEEVLQLWRASFYAAVGLGALVLALIFYSIIRHRRNGSDELPKQTEGNNVLEITYTLIPFVLVGLLFFYGLKVQFTVTDITPAAATAADGTIAKEPLVVDVIGYQWNWRFDLPEQDVTIIGGKQSEGASGDTLPTLVLPVNERVRFNLTTVDVAHSFFVPGFLTKRDLIPGIQNTIEVTPTRTGLFMGHCAEYCGYNHSQMNFRVRIVPQEDFINWIQEKQVEQAQQSEVPVQ